MMRNLRHGAVNTPISGWHSSEIIYLEFTVNIAMIRRFELIPPPDLTPKKRKKHHNSGLHYVTSGCSHTFDYVGR